MLIQFALLIALIFISFIFLSRRQSQQVRAWKKLLFLCLLIFSSIFIIFPEKANEVANLFGVGRGADLLLYVLTVAFIYLIIDIQMKFQQHKTQLHKLARKIALTDALNKYDID